MDRTRSLTWPAALTVVILSIATLGDTCPTHGRAADPAASAAAASPKPVEVTPTPAADFQTAIRPILAVRCAPCHNPGGQMYARLPFDEPAVVASHAEGVRRRLKGEDRQALEKWLATLPPAKPGAPRA